MILGAPNDILERLKIYSPSEVKEKRKSIELAKYSLIYDAFFAASAGGEFHAEERKAISKLRQEINIDERTIEKTPSCTILYRAKQKR